MKNTHPMRRPGLPFASIACVSIAVACAVFALAVPVHAQVTRISDLVDGPAEVHEAGKGFTFTEGPAAGARGDVFFTDIPQERIHVWRAATGKIETWLEQTGKINGLAFRPDGTLLGCQMGPGRRVVVIDPAYG